MKRTTAILLVVLRLVIGWHFLFEGVHKIHDTHLAFTPSGEPAQHKPFSSAGYFREAPGPFAALMRQQLGDADDEALARLNVVDGPAQSLHQRTPPPIDKEWRDYVERFKAHYGLDEGQKAAADARLLQSEDQLVFWLLAGGDVVKKTYPSGAIEEAISTPQRVAEYRQKVQDLRDALGRKLPVFGADVEKARLVQLKGDIAQLRSSLLADVNEGPKLSAATIAETIGQTGDALHNPLVAGVTLTTSRSDLKISLGDLLTKDQLAKGPVPEPKTYGLLWWTDRLTEWGLTIVGACLLLGLFTRSNCLLAAGFLLLTYLAVPPLPWLPTPPNVEGYYLYINKNLIELIALLALATTASGRWFGVDALLHGLGRAVFGAKRIDPQISQITQKNARMVATSGLKSV
jgi:uncharacterized membrane protein YphA (DoxX/SURF4 family)